MSILNELACPGHVRTGYDANCPKCGGSVLKLAGLSGEPAKPVGHPEVTRVGLLVVASPSIAQDMYWTLSQCIKSLRVDATAWGDNKKMRQEYVAHEARVKVLMDLMKDCVEKPRG